ncbi:MAG: hypothetical protein IJF37_09205 [Lachnospiraceae bacterium]|nr:hypothetical protein [Lachnospiraceae bacterium]
MAEQLYTIPVNDAFDTDCECPVCAMYIKLENDALDYTLGPSYMEEDVRAMTDKVGFCKEHAKKMYERGNRLGMALMYQTHTYGVIEAMSKLKPETKSGFLKKADNSSLINYVRNMSDSCFICDRIEKVLDRYIVTIMYLWKHDEVFKEKYKNSKGFCMDHYAMLVEYASKELSGKELESFMEITEKLFIDNMKRVKEDLDWFINKFDYRYKDESWKNGKDALPRMLGKVNSLDIQE